MMNCDQNVLLVKSKAFALRMINLYVFLRDKKQETVLSKQLLRSGTSIGANAREAQRAQSDLDFYAKLYVALKEADESAYWLELLHESGFLSDAQFQSLYEECDELVKILVAITRNHSLKYRLPNSHRNS